MPARGCRKPRKKVSSTTPAERLRSTRRPSGRPAIHGIAAGGGLGSASSPPSQIDEAGQRQERRDHQRPGRHAGEQPRPSSRAGAAARRPSWARHESADRRLARRDPAKPSSVPAGEAEDEERVQQEELRRAEPRVVDLGGQAELAERGEDADPEDAGDDRARRPSAATGWAKPGGSRRRAAAIRSTADRGERRQHRRPAPGAAGPPSQGRASGLDPLLLPVGAQHDGRCSAAGCAGCAAAGPGCRRAAAARRAPRAGGGRSRRRAGRARWAAVRVKVRSVTRMKPSVMSRAIAQAEPPRKLPTRARDAIRTGRRRRLIPAWRLTPSDA